jgi:uncharacterized protein involved in exopolysaccharide biosynthesis
MTPIDDRNEGHVPGDFSEYVCILVSRRRLVAAFVGASCVLAILLSLIGPQVYRAEVTLLPEESRGLDLGGLSDSPIIMDLFTGGGGRREGQVFLEMLSSRSVLEGVVRQAGLVQMFRLDRLPEAEAMEEAIIQLRNRVDVSETEAGILSVKVRIMTRFLPGRSHRQQAATRAAMIANAFADQLNLVNQQKGTSRARAVRQYLEEQLLICDRRLQDVADTLAQYQVAHRAVNLEEQTRAAMEGAGVLRGHIVAAEVELGILRRTMRPENIQVRALTARLEELHRQYNIVQFGGEAGQPGNAGAEFIVPFADLPAVAMRLAVLIRDVKIQETVLELLNAQYYQAKIQEARDVPSLTVLDSAIPPVRRHWPKRKLLVLTTFLASLFASSLLALALDSRDRKRGAPAAPAVNLAEAWAMDRADLAAWMRGHSSRGGTRR